MHIIKEFTWAVFHIARHEEAVARKRPPMIQLFIDVDEEMLEGEEPGIDWAGVDKSGAPL